MASKLTPTVRLEKEDKDYYTFHFISSFKNESIKFKPNEEFSEETMDGRKVKSLVTFEGNKMILLQKGEKTVRVERVFTEDEMIETCSVENVVGTRWFKSVQ